ncbi:hypothetical protein SAMN05444166_6574 [Singulisphaera sp. GP187]|uniref:hypothetical protein n=1 Tax=Singulisphaera sp. GP187 TaxID=1882752 RepID=UPI00092A864C|nr:hypothetical protein [Singulisphaera sp. GP187]SIO60920.1 hypothetical protein SAMN05444166_6574 [Singulisphaera sp. GP187]
MSTNPSPPQEIAQELNDDERQIIEFCRVLQLNKDEALKRLAIPSSSPIHLHGQEIAANLSTVADELAQTLADPVALSGHDDPD